MSVFQTNADQGNLSTSTVLAIDMLGTSMLCLARFTAIITASTNSWASFKVVQVFFPNPAFCLGTLATNSGHNLPLCLFSVFMEVVISVYVSFCRAQCAFYGKPLGIGTID